jgi:hypothetical protein
VEERVFRDRLAMFL